MINKYRKLISFFKNIEIKITKSERILNNSNETLKENKKILSNSNETLKEILKQETNLISEVKSLKEDLYHLYSAEGQLIRMRTSRAINELFDFVNINMQSALYIGGPKTNIWEKALKKISFEGYLLELGVYKGTSINFFADQLPNKIFHGFDSFEGLPEDWTSGHTTIYNPLFFGKGAFATEKPKVRKNIILHKGFFETSLPKWKKSHKKPIAFIHIDCDLYSSTHFSLFTLSDQIHPGCILIFDEFFGYPEWKDGEYKAFIEFANEYNVEYKYLYYTHEVVVVKINKIKHKD